MFFLGRSQFTSTARNLRTLARCDTRSGEASTIDRENSSSRNWFKPGTLVTEQTGDMGDSLRGRVQTGHTRDRSDQEPAARTSANTLRSPPDQ
jgi:hypothetical protein